MEPLTRPERRKLKPAHDDHIALLAADEGFARGIPAGELALAERIIVLPRLDLDAGPWTPALPAGCRGPSPLALLIDGLLLRHVEVGERVSTQLLGPGDVFDPWTTTEDDLLPRAVHWSADSPSTIAVLDGRFAVAAQRWPVLAATAQARLAALGERLAVHMAICQLPRVEQRTLAVLWHLAERFGRMTPDGVVLDLRLKHRLIGELIGAQRPTVSLALTNLHEEGLAMRRPGGALLLAPASRAALATGDVAARVRVLPTRAAVTAAQEGQAA